MSTIQYTLCFDKDMEVVFSVDTERQAPVSRPGPAPAWTRLSHHQCPGCPLSEATHASCPAALDMAGIVEVFNNVPSFSTVHVEVDMLDRKHSRKTDLQSALQSLLGLVMATSACPVLSRMKGPARLHMPFATVDETLFRMIGAYFIGQYRVDRQGQLPDWTLHSLAAFYEQVQEVNRHLKKRLDTMARSDAHLNAIVSLMAVSMLVSFSLDQALENLQPYALG